MVQSAFTRDGKPVDASMITGSDWEALKLVSKPGDFLMPCCKAPAIPKTSINGLHFFSHLSNECETAPETIWHHSGKASVLAALSSLGIEGHDEVPGKSPSGEKWEADVLFSTNGRCIVIELQRSYQHLRDYLRRQERYTESGVECYWLARRETFLTLQKATCRLLLQRDFGNKFPKDGIGAGLLPELPVSVLENDPSPRIIFGRKKSPIQPWLEGIIAGSYQYRGGWWDLD